ncbi:MAG: DNA polymerase I [Treponemataceae bacterium]|nr:DNA polymerase I [Treponemataceae bacterium]
MPKTLYIIDSYGLIYRSYYAFISRPLVNEENENVSAIYGFFNNLLSLIQKNDVHHLVAAFDSMTPTFRHEMYPEYKANRPKTPEDLHAQIPHIEEILTAMGVKVLRQNGFEADDIIASCARKCQEQNWECRILSSDKDLMQLVCESTSMIKSDKTGGWEIVGIDGVEKEWGVKPERMLDILSLIGDTADNVPGVAGIGKVTAQKLLAQYDNLDEILAHASEISGATGKKIQAGIESAEFSRKLIRLCYDVPIDFKLDDYCIDNADFGLAAKLLFSKGIPSIAKRYDSLERKNNKDEKKDSNPLPETEEKYIFEEESEEYELKENTGDYSAILTAEKLNEVIDGFLQNKEADGRTYIALDTETNSLDVLNAKLAGFSICNQERKSFYVPFVTQESSNIEDLFSSGPEYIKQEDAFAALEKVFFNPQVTVIMHNAKFDLQVLTSNGFFAKQDYCCKIYDTMIAAWLLQSEKQSVSLEKLAETKLHLSTIPFESLVPKGKTFFDVPLESAVKYGAEDSDLTLLLWHLFKKQLEEEKLMELFETLEMPLIKILVKMELEGIQIEKSELAKYQSELEDKSAKLEREIFELTGHDFNIASPKQLAQVLFVEKGLTPEKGKKGSTDSEVLEELARIDPLPAKVLEYRKVTKLLSTYVLALPSLADKNNRLHTSFIQTGTATGRLSSRDPNLQNIPVRDESGRKIRMAFSAGPGNVLISADYSQIELVVMAHMSGDKNMCQAFNNGIDIHKATAGLIFGVDAENVSPDMRRTAKTINFGVIYGMSAFRLAQDLGISRTQASDFIKQYFATYSGIQNFLTETISNCERSGYVETIFGRKRYIRSINSRNKIEKSAAERMAVNTPIQGSAADIVKKAMICVFEKLNEKYPQAKMLLQVHDEIIVECPQDISDQVASTIKECMENVVKLNVPLKVSVEIGKRWGEFH